MLEKGLILLVMLALPTAAWAEARPPRYDVNGLCRRLANTPDGIDVQLEQKCLRDQSDALDTVKRLWLDTPAYIQRDCDLRARADGDKDYALLRKCIRDQLNQTQPDVILPTQ
ncbi:hypothetical protein [Magnetospirillum molischianum]|uniref:Secreted protein n=1 Tax=Magnetospirillum molischianum DSM 120 TaxID=1150626 RepID=H8FWD8_MAGML|nr:hypothetical protein [Magnetospirillum molischianum]CCG42676.1 conserved exported hypothetical protein [Magnetospirillum molischianum DSM 120]